MKDEAMKLKTAAEKVVELCGERPLSLGKWFIDMSEACESLREALAEQPAQQEPQAEETVKEHTPQERRDAGEWHCPECFTFGHQHRRGCTAAHGIKENT